ncbi:hypothetical protein CTI12_AA351500 [Artemisia annua]|uniref:Uncharacterized protein n=1 Tax=Artemisia annua TaxID=35608 RepID=A0A2U1MRZ0_ARTAN|nr:hypothetical protein CTI12_AA351500 [Artemisia annua]
MKLNGSVITILCMTFLMLLVCHECSKSDVNDIRSIANPPPCTKECRKPKEKFWSGFCCCDSLVTCEEDIQTCREKCEKLNLCCS